MKNKLLFRSFVILFTFSIQSNAQWQNLLGPYGVSTTSSVFLDSTCFAGTTFGLTESNEAGQNWNYFITGISGTRSSLEFDEGTIIFDRSYNTSGGIYKSINNGSSWSVYVPTEIFIKCQWQMISFMQCQELQFITLSIMAWTGITQIIPELIRWHLQLIPLLNIY